MKPLRAFRKLIRNLYGSYEFTDEYKKNKKLVETALKDYEVTKVRLDDTQRLIWENKEKLELLREDYNELLHKYNSLKGKL